MKFSSRCPHLSFFTFLALAAVPGSRAESLPEIKEGSVFAAKDSLNVDGEPNKDAAACLDHLKWKCEDFQVKCEAGDGKKQDWILRFPTAVPSGDAVNDLVALEWNLARDANGKPIKAPAMVVVHESGRGMTAGRFFAAGLAERGLHTFLIHLPGYGRRTSALTADISKMLPAMRQAVADVRRARDAVAALPLVEPNKIGLQGTSLGGFVVACVAGLDGGFHKTFIMLAGGNLAEVLLTGQRDAAGIRRQLFQHGIDEKAIREHCQIVEPLRLAHRVKGESTWMFTALHDEVVPVPCCEEFAKRANLPDGHHYQFPLGHYNAVLLMPTMIQRTANLMHDRPVDENLPPAPPLPAPPKGK